MSFQVFDKNGVCCRSGALDVCGICNGAGRYIDIHGVCCTAELDAQVSTRKLSDLGCSVDWRRECAVMMDLTLGAPALKARRQKRGCLSMHEFRPLISRFLSKQRVWLLEFILEIYGRNKNLWSLPRHGEDSLDQHVQHP